VIECRVRTNGRSPAADGGRYTGSGRLAGPVHATAARACMQQSILVLVLALMVFAVALDLRIEDLRYVARSPLAVGAGLVAQFVLLPVATWLATLALPLAPATEAAMMLVAACPGGALSNAVTWYGRGNLALSLSISAVSNVLALVLTPFNFAWMVAANPETARWAHAIAVDPRDLWTSLLMLLALPMACAMLVTRFAPAFAGRIRRPLGRFAIAALGVFIVLALASQWATFVRELGRTLPLVVAHNALGLLLGWAAARAARLPDGDARAVIVESGMQNAGLALGIVAAQFDADIAMVAVASMWGIWHIVSGGALATLWRRRDDRAAALDAARTRAVVPAAAPAATEP
jgi:BASS family bile acid:Na+ symporter